MWGEIKEGVGETVIRMPNKIINENSRRCSSYPWDTGKSNNGEKKWRTGDKLAVWGFTILIVLQISVTSTSITDIGDTQVPNYLLVRS